MKARLLIVDDLPSNRYLMRMLLETRGYEIEEAEGGGGRPRQSARSASRRDRHRPPDAGNG